MSVLRRYWMVGLGFPRLTSARATLADKANTEYALSNLPIERLYDWEAVLETGFNVEQKENKNRSAHRSHVRRFVNWCFENGILINPAILTQKQKRIPEQPQAVGKRPKLRPNDIDFSKFALAEKDLTADQAQLLKTYGDYLEKTRQRQRRQKSIRDTTSSMRQRAVRKFWGFLHNQRGIPKEGLTFDSIIGLADFQDQVATDQVIDDFEDLALEYADFMAARGCVNRTISSDLVSLTRLCQYQYRGQYLNKHGNDIPLMGRLRELINYYEELSSNELAAIPLELKWLDLPHVINHVTLPAFRWTEHRTATWSKRSDTKIADDFANAIMFAVFTLMPPRRSGEWCRAKIAMACDLKSRPDDLREGEWIWPLPSDRRSQDEIKFSYLTRQYVHVDPQTGEKFGPYLGTMPPADRYLERVPMWFKDTPPRAAKSGDSHRYQRITILNRQVYQGKTLYDFLEAYLMGYWRDKRGNWVSLGRSLERPHEKFKYHELRSSLLKIEEASGEQPAGWFFLGRKSGKAIRIGDFGTKFALAFNRMTMHAQLGRRYMNPHLMRSVYAVYMIENSSSLAELKSLATAMGHTMETLERIYDKRRPDQKMRLIEVKVQKTIDDICGASTTWDLQGKSE
ncbi:hypothetical protein [Halomicronema sp. CCY15110]|uniref:hypothetical protein n=1 Tax=Halomicronema sp. CCY15110 TaxID=2767773 RepID=UPI00194F2BA7|nr:hypothetical protein [Halomicronema sp. CCY15110]